MEIRQFVKGTIISHLINAINEGVNLDITPLVSHETQELILGAIAEVGDERLTPIKEQVPQTISFDEIKLVLAIYKQSSKKNSPTPVEAESNE